MPYEPWTHSPTQIKSPQSQKACGSGTKAFAGVLRVVEGGDLAGRHGPLWLIERDGVGIA